MKAAIKMNETAELRSAALTGQAVEQVSGGAGELNGTPKEDIIIALAEAAKMAIQFFETKPTTTQLQKWLMEDVNRTAALVELFSKEAAVEYRIMSEEEKKTYWKIVFTRI